MPDAEINNNLSLGAGIIARNFDIPSYTYNNTKTNLDVVQGISTPLMNFLNLEEITPGFDNCNVSLSDNSTNLCNISTLDMSSLNINSSTSNSGTFDYENKSATPSSPNMFESVTSQPNNFLNNIRVSNANRLIIGQLNINSLRNKIDALKTIISGKLDILVITESKLDNTFPTNQFLIDGFSVPFRLDRDSSGVGSLYM